MRSRTLLTLAVAAVVSPVPTSVLLAQQPVPGRAVRLIPSGTATVLPQDPRPAATTATPPNTPPNAAQDPAAAKAQAAANAKHQKFMQLQWDRRPSTVLKVWSQPELKPYDPAEEKAKEAKEKGKDGAQPAAAPPAAVTSAAAPNEEELQRMLIEQLSGHGVVIEGEITMSGNVVNATPPNPAAAAAGAGAAPGTDQALEEKKLQRELEMLQRDVTLSRWHKLAEFLTTLPEASRKPAFEHFLRAVLTPPPRPEDQRVPPNLQERNTFRFDDVLALAGIAPGGLDKKQIPMLGPVVQRAIEAGNVFEELLRLLAAEVAKPETEQRLDRREAALLLATIQRDIELQPFLPTAAEAEAANDREGLNLLARLALALFAKEKKSSHLATAWTVTQAALAQGDIGDAEKAEALRRAVELAPKVDAQLGPAWLGESFTKRPERGMEIIATIGAQVARGFSEQPANVDYRATGLRLQKTAVEALLKDAPQLAEQWRPTLGLLAMGWIGEATHSYQNSRSDSFGPVMERDDFGNYFYVNRRMGSNGAVQAVEPVDLLQAQPGAQWVAMLEPSLQPHFATVSAQLWLKVNEPAKAFPYIEQLAKVNPRKGKELAHEFLRVWMRNSNPNTNNRTNSYMFIYGFDQRSSGIPLTRSKQERNLEELGSWVERLRQLPIGGVDEKLLSEAFVAAHSAAEVYRLETIEKVFGDVTNLDPVLLGELLGKMRTNLATVWRLPAVQEQQKTKRSQRETLEEVARGYDTALSIAKRALQKRGRHWALLSVVAAIQHDQVNFGRELQRDSGFAEGRKIAFELFAAAAAHYVENAGDLRLDQETLGAFDTWFYAALGASDLAAVEQDTVLAKNQLPLIRQAIDALPKGSAERHLDMFANALFTRMSAVKPHLKYRYLDAGFAIVGEHPQAVEAKKVWDYYQDLLRELRLEAVVDGPTEVGTEPFGLRIDIVHSPEIERESGGFAKYATNQNSGNFGWNYGRPLENYRDKFNEAVTAALRENFEVISVTFNGEAMQSKPTDVPGWRATPYAYLLLKALGPQVDRVPAIQLDFDFNDTSGFTVLPVGSAPVVIDASTKAERPYAELEVTQLLDERRADEGKVTLEIKAKAKGLVPPLESFLQLDLPGFTVAKRDDQGASVDRFAEDQAGVQSERTWLLSLTPESASGRPNRFVFGRPLHETTKAVFQRYDDADLETVTAEVALNRLNTGVPVWAWVAVGVASVAYLLWFCFAKPSRGSGPKQGALLRMPQQVNAFTVLALLEQVGAQSRLDDAQRRELVADMTRIQACHFGRQDDPSLDLEAVAKNWLRRAS